MNHFARLTALLSFLILLGCERQPIGSAEIGFRNLSTEVIWVESATFSKADVGTGHLKPRTEYNRIVIPRFEEVPTEMVVKWWRGGNHKAPSAAELVFEQKLNLPNLDPESEIWHVYITFGKDGEWTAKDIK